MIFKNLCFQSTYGRREIEDELKCTQAITVTLINKILYSKRLLVDHVEALEQCLLHMPELGASIVIDKVDSNCATTHKLHPSREIFTARNACLMMSTTVLEHLVTPKSLRVTLLPSIFLMTAFGTLYMVKNIFVFRNKYVERELGNLIRTIEEFGNCIRRNMTYFNEIIIMKQQELIESRQIERAWDCITAAKEVTEILYDATRKLEFQYPLPNKFSEYYSPMEELRDCEYFKNNVTDYSPRHIKDFHNIFAYVQSQFLLRLALTIATKSSISELNVELGKINSLIHQLVQEEENHFKNLTFVLNKKNQVELDALNVSKAMQNRSGPVAVLQDSSLKLSARMVAVAAECQALDIILQRLNEAELDKKDNANQLAQVANSMHSIENALSVCFDDFQRLMLYYSKFLSSKLADRSEASEQSGISSQNGDSEYPESFLRVEISNRDGEDNAEKSDDFYAYMFDEQQAKALEEEEKEKDERQKKFDRDLEILNFEKRITKGKFHPVLKQLKERINPIRQDMLDKERRVLAAKGINVDQLFRKDDEKEEHVNKDDNEKAAHFNLTSADNRNAASNDAHDSDSEGSADLEFERRSKTLKERDNFEEMRNFLAQKQAHPHTSPPIYQLEFKYILILVFIAFIWLRNKCSFYYHR